MHVLFSYLYDINAMAVVHTALLLVVLGFVVAAVLDGRHWTQTADVVAITALSTITRLLLNSAGLIRVAHPTMNLDMDIPALYNYGYPVSLNGLTSMLRPLVSAQLPEFDLALRTILVLGCLTPAAFYVLTRVLGTDRRLAWVIALLVVFNPTHILYSTNYDFFVPSVFFELLAHTLLILWLRSGALTHFAGFFLASAAFYHARPENSAVFYFHLACLLYAVWKLPLPRRRSVPMTLVFAAYNLAYHIDWMGNAHYEDNHVVTHLWLAPFKLIGSLFDPTWNHFIDWPWSPPYIVVLVLLGMWRALRQPQAIHLYAVIVMGAMMGVYHELSVPSPWHNARFFLNFLPATAIFVLSALTWLQARWQRTWLVAVATVVVCFLPYLPKLIAFDTIQSQEYDFYRHQVAPQVTPAGTTPGTTGSVNLWRQALRGAFYEAVPRQAWGPHSPLNDAEVQVEFEESFLNLPGVAITSDAQKLASGDWVYLGASCYQFSSTRGQMTPECEAQLHDPRNRRVLTSRDYPPCPNHQVTPWATQELWRTFPAVRFYLLRRS